MSDKNPRAGRPKPAPAETLNEIFGIRTAPDILPNRAGIGNLLLMQRYEAMVTSITIPLAYERLRHTKKWGLKQWRLAHQMIFGSVYDWAGKLRTVNIKKQDTFADKDRVESLVARVFQNFYRSYAIGDDLPQGLKELPLEKLPSVFAQLYSDLNMVHPFREGNGRSLQVVVTALARQADYNFRWENISPKKWSFDEACITAAAGNISPLAQLFGEIIETSPGETHVLSRHKRMTYHRHLRRQPMKLGS